MGTRDKEPDSRRLRWMATKRNDNRRETKTVPSKRWSEG